MEASLRFLSISTQLSRRVPVALFSGRSLGAVHNLSNAGNHFPTFPQAHIHQRLSTFRVYRSFPKSNLPRLPLCLSSTHSSASCFADGDSDLSVSKSEEGLFKPTGLPACGDLGDQGLSAVKNPFLTVVLLGWLGAEKKHLRRYAELYNSSGIRTIPFIITVKELIGPDLGRRVERRIAELAKELMSWLSEKEKDRRERGLLFHTFRNTGWLAYGALLDHLQQKGDFMQKIKGCIIDSGGDPEINPQVWAAGFSSALLKKRSDLMHSDAIPADSKTRLVEKLLLNILETLFSTLLTLPDVNKRLRRIINILSNQQPRCPQLYLYSTADKVIPFRSVELFIQQQKNSGKEVLAYNFDSSPHVDHLRSFPSIYSTKISEFLFKCISTAGMTN